MDLANLYSLINLISLEGWLHISDIIDEIQHQVPNIEDFETSKPKLLPFSNRESASQDRGSTIFVSPKFKPDALKENPYTSKAFKDSGFDPYGGFFKIPHPTMHNAYAIAYEDTGTVKIDGNFLDLKCTLYSHFKLPPAVVKDMVTGYIAMTTLLKKPAYGKGPNVLASVNGLKIALMPDLKLAAGFSGADSFGVYHFAGKLDYILMNSEIKEAVINDFNETTRQKLWDYASKIHKSTSAQTLEQNLAAKSRIILIVITMLHELGHRVEKKCLDKQKAELHNFWTKYKSLAPISDYGISSPAEWFAECWAAWVVDGLSYSEKVKADFLKMLFPEVIESAPLQVFMTSGLPFDFKKLQHVFSNIQTGERFKLEINYDIGPSLAVIGNFIKIINHEIPTIKYEDGSGIKTINFFPNRKIVNIKCSKV